MFDIRAIRDNPQDFDKAWARRGLAPKQTDAILKLDAELRALKTELQTSLSRRNEESQKIGEIKKAGGDAKEQMEKVALMKDTIAAMEEVERKKEGELKNLLSTLPNILADDVPEGKGEADNKEVRKVGEVKVKKGPDHAEIGEKLGMMDFEAAAKMSGSRFTLLSGGLARMERALAQFMLDTHTQEHGYTECSPPLLVNDAAVYGTGQLPKFAEDLYATEVIGREEWIKKLRPVAEAVREKSKGQITDEAFERIFKEKVYQNIYNDDVIKINRRWLVPTSEVPLTNIVMDSIVDADYLPRRYTAFTPCFRSEAGAAGKDTAGMLRQHQFYKVELVSITKPEDSKAEHERMTKCAETILERLGLPFRTVVLCTADTGFGATKTYDIEVWLPGQGKYREISSCSNCGDFQARRMNARYKGKNDKHTTFVHTLNGSGVAVGRALIAVMENYYDPADGGIVVPEVLRPYMGGITKITAPKKSKADAA